MKKLLSLLLVVTSVSAFAANNNADVTANNDVEATANNLGDVNFGLDSSPSNHAVAFRLVLENGAETFETACISPGTGFPHALTNGAIGRPTGKLQVQARDCTGNQWVALGGKFDYDNRYYYYIAGNLSNRTYRFQQ